MFDYSTYIQFCVHCHGGPMPAAARSKLCSSFSAWSGVFISIAMSSA